MKPFDEYTPSLAAPPTITLDARVLKGAQIIDIARRLSFGEVILYPTDTIYGLGCDPFRKESVQKLNALKGRAADKSYLLLVGGMDWVKRLSVEPPAAMQPLTDRFWPGPLTLILRASATVPLEIRGPGDTVALRWAKSPFLEELFRYWTFPLISTSANRSGQPTVKNPADLDAPFLSLLDCVVDVGYLRNPPSTLLDMTASPPKILREGCLEKHLLAPFLE